MSDLQCPAVVVLIDRERVASGDAIVALAEKRLACVFVARAIASDEDALAAATQLAARAGCTLGTLTEAVDGATLARAVDELADLHRGETIAVVASDDAIRDALGAARAPAGAITVAIDSSGWSVVDAS
jgi:hypothetical protein